MRLTAVGPGNRTAGGLSLHGHVSARGDELMELIILLRLPSGVEETRVDSSGLNQEETPGKQEHHNPQCTAPCLVTRVTQIFTRRVTLLDVHAPTSCDLLFRERCIEQ